VPAVLFGGVLILAVAGLARAACGEHQSPKTVVGAESVVCSRVRLYAAACVLLAPAFWFGSLLMTIDVPYSACWGLAAWAAWLALRRGSQRAWLGLGAALAVGFLFKYTVLLLVPGIAAYAWVIRRRLRLAPRWDAWAMGGLALFALGLVPVLVWNWDHGWPTVRHLLGHLRVEGGDMKVWPEDRGWHWRPTWTLELIGTQVALLGPQVVVMGWAGWRAWSIRREEPEAWTDRLFLLCCAAPIFLFYLGVSLLAEPEGNWPLAGHVSLLALTGWGAAEAVREWKDTMAAWRATPPPRPWKGIVTPHPDTVPRLAWRVAVILGVAVAVLSLRADWLAASPPIRLVERGLKKLGAIPADRPMVPLGRLMGAQTMAADADRLVRETSRRTGHPAFVIAQQYGRASLLAFYLPGRPTVYCSSSKGDGRRNQYDLWADTSLDDPGLFGRPAVLVGGRMDEWTPAFARVTEIGPLEGETKRDGVTRRPRPCFIGEGYRGWPKGGSS
jgi:hypothetical protein